MKAASKRFCVRDGELTEASASNVFIVKNGTVLTPPKSHLILPGITYTWVLEILRAKRDRPRGAAGRRERAALGRRDLGDFVFEEVLPITTLDESRSAEGEKGKARAGRPRRVYALYQQYKAQVCAPRLMPEYDAPVLAFPCEFPIKIMGKTQAGFAQADDRGRQAARARFRPATLEMRPSREGKYLSLTCTIRAVCRASS